MKYIDLVLFKELAKLTYLSKFTDKWEKVFINNIENFSHLCSDLKNQKESLDLSTYEINYIGEFYERYEERGFICKEKQFITLAFFYAISKDCFSSFHFNHYQTIDFEAKIIKESEKYHNIYMDYVMYIITNEKSFLERMFSYKEMQLDDFYFFYKLLKYDFNKIEQQEKELKEVSEQSTKKLKPFVDYVSFFSTYEFVIETKDILRSCFQSCFLKIASDILNDSELTQSKIVSVIIKASNDKLKLKNLLQYLEEKGFKESHISYLNYILMNEHLIGFLKIQNAMISCFEKMVSCTSKFDQIEEDIVAILITNMYKQFAISMQEKTIENLNDAILYYEFHNKINNIENYIFIHNLLLEKTHNTKKYLKTLCIDVLEDSCNQQKIEFFRKVRPEILPCIFENNLLKEHLKDEKEIRQIITIYEGLLGFPVLNFYNSTSSLSEYSFLCRLGIFDPLQNFIKKNVLDDYHASYYKHETGKNKYLFFQYLKEHDLSDSMKQYIDSGFYLNSKTDKVIFLENISLEEQKEYIEMIISIYRFLKPQEFSCLFFNILLNHNNLLPKLYSPEEIVEILDSALKMCSIYDNQNCFSSFDNFRHCQYQLKARFQTEEQKQVEKELAILKQQTEEMRKKEILNLEIKEFIEEILKDFDSKKDSIVTLQKQINKKGFDSLILFHSETYKNKILTLFQFPMITKSQLDSFFTCVTKLFEKKVISMEEMKRIIFNLQFLPENETIKEEDVYE